MDTTGPRLARVVTEVLSPAVVAAALLLVVAWHATGHDVLATAAWGVVVAVFLALA